MEAEHNQSISTGVPTSIISEDTCSYVILILLLLLLLLVLVYIKINSINELT